jgi:predicted NBD/HSP70 family sugar kinase
VTGPLRRASEARWQTASELLALLRREPGITRAALAQRLGLSSGSATEIAARLRDVRLLAEEPALARGRGRPTTVLRPHPDGPLVLVVDLRHGDWRWALVGVDGRLPEVTVRPHDGRDPDTVLAAVRRAADRLRGRYGRRLRAVSVAVAGTVRHGRLLQASTLGWGAVDLTRLTAGTDLALLVGNDATLAGVAETRTGAAREAHTVLHLAVEVGIGGALVVGGRPVEGLGGAGGEYGHLPFGDRALPCPCGASGCWDLEIDGRALARHLGEDAGPDPRAYTYEVVARAAGRPASAALGLARASEPGVTPDPRALHALRTVAGALGAGIAGLVNAHAPELVTLGGLAGLLRAAAPAEFEAAYLSGLMTFHREAPPPVRQAAHGAAGALHGAAAVGLDRVTREGALAEWAAEATA